MATNDFERLNRATLHLNVAEQLDERNPSRAYVQETLNTALKARLSEALAGAGHPELAQLVQATGPVDIAAVKDLSLRTFVAQLIARMLPADAPTRSAIEAALATVLETTTVGDLLALDTPIKDHPLFRAAAQQAAYRDSVARLHAVLGRLGIQLPASEVDGNDFGPATQQAVQRFQQQHGLPVIRRS
jgi:Putative peptidoglycan binding domain